LAVEALAAVPVAPRSWRGGTSCRGLALLLSHPARWCTTPLLLLELLLLELLLLELLLLELLLLELLLLHRPLTLLLHLPLLLELLLLLPVTLDNIWCHLEHLAGWLPCRLFDRIASPLDEEVGGDPIRGASHVDDGLHLIRIRLLGLHHLLLAELLLLHRIA